MRTPEGVLARVVDGRTFHVHTTGDAKDVAIDGTMSGVLSGRRCGTLRLEPLDVERLEKR